MKNLIVLTLAALLVSTATAQNYGKLHFFDDFDDNSNEWIEKKEKGESIKVDKGHYIIKRTDSETSNYYFIKTPEIDFETQNYVIEAKIKQTWGDENNGYGLNHSIYKDYTNLRQCFVTSTQYYKINHYYSKKDHFVKKWTQDKKIVNAKKKYNIFRIERNANMLKFFVNDVLVGYDEDNQYFTTRIGFFVSGDNEIQVDYIKVWTSPLDYNFVENALEDVKVENLGGEINTEAHEKACNISPDGKTMYFGREEYEGNIKFEETDVYYSELNENGKWGKGKSLGKPINNASNNSIIAVMPDGNTLLIMNEYYLDGSSKGQGISISKRGLDGWRLPENLEIDDYQNHSIYTGSTISPSGKVLISSVERDNTEGERDLYVSFNKGHNKWTKPKSLGKILNTFANEDSPFIAADNKTLYFSSEGHSGVGGADVFVTRRLDDTWTNWSEPKNLGRGINSTSSEYGFKISAKGEYAYLYKWASVEKGGFGKSDLFRIKLSESAKPEPIVFIEGNVYDSETNKPLASEITYEDLNTKEEIGIANSEPIKGKYKIALPYGKVYGFLAHLEGYYPVSQSIDLVKKGELRTIHQDLYLTAIKKGVTIRLNNIFFEHNKAELQEISFTELDRLVEVLEDNKKIKIEIGGYTDNVGSDSYNQKLSENRALSVKNYLISKGISEPRLTYKGYGEERPTDSNDTEEGRANNRRVEFMML